jgi:hypothetical protein
MTSHDLFFHFFDGAPGGGDHGAKPGRWSPSRAAKRNKAIPPSYLSYNKFNVIYSNHKAPGSSD